MSYPKSANNKKRPVDLNDSNSQSFSPGRMPPHTNEAEESVLGAVLIDNQVMSEALQVLTAEDFYRISHQKIFEAMSTLDKESKPIDIITLGEALRSKSCLDEIGGLEYLGRLSTAVPSAANTLYYAKLVKEKSLRRKMIRAAGNVIGNAYTDDANIETFLDTSEQEILAVSESRARSEFHKISDVVQGSIRKIEELFDNKNAITGIPTGFIKLDAKTAGLQPSDLIIIAARPSMGKTALALSILQHVGITCHGAVALFSLEMSKEQLVLRMLCSEARVPNQKVRVGNLAEHDFPRLVSSASKIAEAPIFIDDTPALPINELRAKCRRLHREHKLSLIVVDYLQLMRSPAYQNSREQEIADISRSLKALAKELNVPVVALSQLNRSLEQRNDKRPMMSDLRESGAIEQDADIIMFIYRDEVYNQDSPDKGVAEIIVGKHRSGPTGIIRLAFSGEITRFDNLEERDDVVSLSEGESGETATFGFIDPGPDF
jgi:replicative DNA helicase